MFFVWDRTLVYPTHPATPVQFIQSVLCAEACVNAMRAHTAINERHSRVCVCLFVTAHAVTARTRAVVVASAIERLTMCDSGRARSAKCIPMPTTPPVRTNSAANIGCVQSSGMENHACRFVVVGVGCANVCFIIVGE